MPDRQEATLRYIRPGYVARSLPFGYGLVRLTKRVDIRAVGNGNIGAQDVWLTLGRRYGIPVVLLDVLKGFVPTLLAAQLVGALAGALTGGAAMLGHIRPLFLKFERGGKAVATAGGAYFGLAPELGLIGGGVWAVAFLLSRYASVGSLATALALPPIAFLIGEPWPVLVYAVAASAVVIYLHRANIARLRAGTENRFQFRRAARA